MNVLYDHARQSFLNAEFNLTSDNIKVCLLDQSYPGAIANLANDSTYADIAAYVIGGTKSIVTLTGKTTSFGGTAGIPILGKFNASNVTMTAVAAGKVVGYVVIFKDNTGNVDGAPIDPTNSKLITLLDTGYGVGSGTNGGDITISWDITDGIFRI